MPKLTDKVLETFDYDDESTITIRYLKPGEQVEIDNSGMDMRGKQTSVGSDDMLTEIGFDFAKKRRKFLLAVIEGWTGFVNISGDQVKCTPANILKFSDEEGDRFYESIEKEHEKLKEKVEAEEEEAAGN